MLEFLVLGEIPGTQIQYNFYDVMLAVAWTLFFLETYMITRRWRLRTALAAQKQSTTKTAAGKDKSKAKKSSRKAIVSLPAKPLAN